jgi:hypothetical protein
VVFLNKLITEIENKSVDRGSGKIVFDFWACPRQMTGKWGCPTILERVYEEIGKPDVYFGLTDGINDKEGVTVDIDESNNPDVVSDWKDMPFENGEFEFGFWDPPYDRLYPRCFEEIRRVVSKRIAILHQLIYENPQGWHKTHLIAITTGPRMRMRCLQVYERNGERLEAFC